MRNIVFAALLAVVVLLSGFFTVDQREVALLSNSTTPQKPSVFVHGIHWKTPFVGDLTYIYTNMRSSYLASSQTFSLKNGQKFNLRVVINWQVVSPVSYLNYLNAHSLKNLDSILSRETLQQLDLLTNEATSLQGFEELVNARLTNLPLNKFGIKLVNVGVLSFTPSATAATSIASESSLTLSPESAYLLAQQIKTSADSEQQTSLAKLRAKNPQFFDYFMVIHQLGQTAKTKEDVPAFAKLYPPQQKEPASRRSEY